MKKDGMGVTYSMHWRGGKCLQNFSQKTWSEETVWETWV